MVEEQQPDINELFNASDYVRSRGIKKAKKEKQEWQNILKTVAMNLKMKAWIRELLATKYKGV